MIELPHSTDPDTTVGAAARHLRLLALILAAAFACSLMGAQPAASKAHREGAQSALPRQIWAVAFDPAALSRSNASKLARLRAAGINSAITKRLSKAQLARLRKFNARSRLMVLSPRRLKVCQGPAAATCAL